MRKMKRPRGMRDVQTALGLFNRSKPSTRAQVVTQLARLEHERMRLERERKIWMNKLNQTEQRIHMVLGQIDKLNHMSDELAVREGMKVLPQKAGQTTMAQRRRDQQQNGSTYRTFTMEY